VIDPVSPLVSELPRPNIPSASVIEGRLDHVRDPPDNAGIHREPSRS
jgi:hypothetical protein